MADEPNDDTSPWSAFSGQKADRFWSIRGKAIGAYAGLEQSLCLLFATLAGVLLDVSGIIFFRVTAVDRHAMLTL